MPTPPIPPAIRADVRAYLDAMAAQPRPPFSDALIAMIRQMPPGAMPSPDLPVGEIAVARDTVMPGPAGEIALRLYDPRRDRGAGPVVVFYHGGGFVVGSIDTHAAMAAEIARGLDLPVVSVEYRLAPEHAWPAAPEDCIAAARWVAGGPAELGVEATGLVLCGDSAGGNLAIVTALALRDQPAAVPVEILWPIYPVTEQGSAPSSYKAPSRAEFAEGYGLGAQEMAYFDKVYAADAADWRASPLRADLAGLPPMLLVTAGLDPLRDEGRAFAAKAIEAGCDVTYREMAGTIHGFASYRSAIPSAQGDMAAIIAAAKEMLGR